MEEDFLAWKDDMWTAVTKHMHLSKSQATYQPFISLERQERVENLDADLHLGGISQQGHSNSTSGSFGPQNSYLATIVESRELFTSKERNCLHFELDIGSLSYTTGDHIAIWPSNSDDEVTRFLTTFGFAHDRDAVFTISALDTATKVPFAGPITLENIARNHLEICGAV
jgi:NADPH-ferrihemoprotein reductase